MTNQQEFPQQQETLQLLRQKIQIAKECISDAYETDFFSDAKSFIYEIQNLLVTTKQLSPEVKQQLLPLAEEGYMGIINKMIGSLGRLSQASASMNKLNNKVDELLQGYTL